VLASALDWVSSSELALDRQQIAAAVADWRRDWESLDVEAYFSHYAEDLSLPGREVAEWVTAKRRVLGATTTLSVSISDLSIQRVPGEDGLVVTTFTQDYRSDRYADVTVKQLYWRRDADDRWRIVLETQL
jgi:ketosteroid isomerase-like protein